MNMRCIEKEEAKEICQAARYRRENTYVVQAAADPHTQTASVLVPWLLAKAHVSPLKHDNENVVFQDTANLEQVCEHMGALHAAEYVEPWMERVQRVPLFARTL